MCGISAIIGKTIQNKKDLNAMLLPIIHRGEKKYFNESTNLKTCILGMNRLAIVDREKAKQPIKSSDGRYYIVFNGEIYNYKNLQKELTKKGYKFSTNSDTEVLVNGYAEWGSKLLDKISGMFVFFIFDKKENTFFVARDQFGIKPLYWAIDKNKTYYFASEIKSLSQNKKIEQINIFPPSHFMAGGKLKKYWSFPKVINKKITEKEAVIEIRKLFDNAIKKRVQTDLPIAVYLSGGIDSTAVLATTVKYHPNVTAIIVGNKKSNDKKIAIKYCKENNIKYIIGTPPSEKDLAKNIKNIIKITESFEPNMIRQSAISYYIAKTASDGGFKVILCGEGADELFAGYPEFAQLKTNQEIEQGIFSFLSDLHRTQLQRVDRTSMAFTTEVRVPFLDKDLANYAMRIPASLKIKKVDSNYKTKYILREAMSNRLPRYIYNREKIVLSEGAGYKGNQKVGGLFYDIVSKAISDNELNSFKNKYPEWNLETKEDIYYFKHYLELGYEKAFFNQQRTTVNKIDTFQENTQLAQKIINSFNTWKFKREQPNTEEQMFKNILAHVDQKKSIEFVMYWGKGKKIIAEESGEETLTFLKEFTKSIEQEYLPGINLTIIFTDTHALLNGYKQSESKKYFDSVKKLTEKNGFLSILLSDLVKYNESNLCKKVNKVNIHKDLLESLQNSSLKHYKKIKDHEVGAKLYYLQNQLEKEVISKRFKNFIFLTYNGSELNDLFPTSLPIFYMYSLKKGSSIKPWFSD